MVVTKCFTEQKTTDINKDKQNNVLIIMYLLAVAIKRDSSNMRTPETSAISFEARPGISFGITSVQSVVRYCTTFHFKLKQLNSAGW